MQDDLHFIIKDTEYLGLILSDHNSTDLQRTILLFAKDLLNRRVTNSTEFKWVLSNLSSVQDRTYVFLALKERLPSFISKGKDFEYVFEYLTAEERTQVLEKIKSEGRFNFSGMDSFNFNRVLNFLSLEERSSIFDFINSSLKHDIKRGVDLGFILEYLNQEERDFVFNEMQNFLPSLITRTADFNCALKFLTSEQRNVAFLMLEKEFRTFIINETF